MDKSEALSIMTVLMAAIAVGSFFLNPVKYEILTPDRVILWIRPWLFYYVAIPLILISNSLNIYLFIQLRKDKKSLLLPVLVLGLYLAFAVYVMLFARIELNQTYELL